MGLDGALVVDGPATPAPTAERAAPPRAVPDPGVRLPQVAVPTVLVWVASLLLWSAATVAAVQVVDGDLSAWWLLATIPAHTAVTFSMFTVLHESVHHAAGRLSWVNALLGRLSMPFVAAWGTFSMFAYLHIEHHRNTNEGIDRDPDAWTEQGPTWQLPLRWLAMDLWYARWYVPRLPSRPRRERRRFLANVAAAALVVTALVTTGHGVELLVVYVVPQRLGVGILAWWFDWLPHHDLDSTATSDRFRATRVRVGWERVMTPLMFSQNYHLVHHIHPAIPFYRYVQAWKRTANDYLERDAPLATAWGRSLSADEYRAWRELTTEAGAGTGRARFHALRVSSVERLTPDAVCVTLAVPQQLRKSFRFRPGQHLVVRATVDGEQLRRSYSICTTPASGLLRIAVKQVERGRFSAYVNTRLRAGDVLEAMPPSGSFVLTDAPGHGRHLAAVAAGSGITPVLSILASALAEEPASRATLLYANRSLGSALFAAELDALVEQHDGRLRVVHVLDGDDAPTGPTVVRGRLTEELLDRLLDDELLDADAWYLCGPSALTDLVVEALAARDVDRDRMHRELFVTPTSAPDQGDHVAADVTVTLDGERHELTTAGDESLLEAALRGGLDAPYSCTGGACGTCRARLVLGTVQMQQNHALPDTDVAAGWVLTCQARPTSAEVAVDYDGS